MKHLHLIVLTLAIVLQGMPITALADELPDAFVLPEAQVSEAYEVDIETLLRDKYRLKLESDVRAAIFQWSFDGGDLPPGLMLRSQGILAGKLRAPRSQPYRFRVKVVDMALPDAAPLRMEFSLMVAPQRIRLTSIDDGPRLTPLNESAALKETEGVSNGTAIVEASGKRRDVNTPSRARGNRNSSRSGRGSHAVIPDATTSSISASPAPQVGVLCNTIVIPPPPQPTTPFGSGVYLIDARNGNLVDTSTMHIVSSRQQIRKKNGMITLIVDNKNPYLYSYKYNSTRTVVQETETAAFLALIGGPVADVLPAPAVPDSADAADGGNAENMLLNIESDRAKNKPGAKKEQPCEKASQRVVSLKSEMNRLEMLGEAISLRLQAQRDSSIKLTSVYNAARIPLYTPNRSRPDLYRDSKGLLDDTCTFLTVSTATDLETGAVIHRGVDPVELDQLKRDMEALKRRAARLEEGVDAVKEDFPDCIKVLADELRGLKQFARELSTVADENLVVRNKIVADLDIVLAGRGTVLSVLNNPHAFFDEHAEGNFEDTTLVATTLEVTPIPNVPQAVAVPGSPFKSEFKFGEAPYFTLSGGLIFSPLRKRQFVRIQGFERDRAGNQVLVDGKPNLTTVVGVDEDSPTRITPAVFLNGRLPGTSMGVLDGIHLTLGVTAKNDKAGTDIEYLVGPSFSFFEHKMFFTVGGYAGKQQKLAGDFYEGLAVPSTVDELPIQKDYRWNIGFALSYRIPGLSK